MKTALVLLALLLAAALPLAAQTDGSLERVRRRGVLLWGGDAEGAAPYTFPDPANPSRMIGYEVELADEIARELGVRAQLVQTPWDRLPQALVRGDVDIIKDGIEVTENRKQFLNFSRPYYRFYEALMVRQDNTDIHGMSDLAGKKVGTLKGALAADLLAQITGVEIVSYDGQVEPYRDLSIGRLDAVLLDYPVARYYGEKIPGLKYADRSIGGGDYAVGVRKEDVALLTAIDQALERIEKDGRLDQILRRWGLVGDSAPQFQVSTEPLTTYLPLLLRAAVMTVFLSVTSMALAIGLGLVLCLTRKYGTRLPAGACQIYIELFRGTPLLLQLLVLYFGLPVLGINLPAWAAALIGLGMNFAAYEAEMYRAGIESVPAGQMDAALALGMTGRQAVTLVILPQAFRISLPGSTSNFISLFKDSSLCSTIGVVELTKQFNILAVSTWRVLELGLLTAALYLMMSYPLSLLARRLERRLSR